jgi:hypothetical protein
MSHIADTPGFDQDKAYTDYVAQVKALKSAKQLDEIEQLLIALVNAVEAEPQVESFDVTPC